MTHAACLYGCSHPGSRHSAGRGTAQADRAGDRSASKEYRTDTLSRKDAAEQAGMSKRQAITAIRVANVPEPEFERQVESPNPPTVTALAEINDDNLILHFGGNLCLKHYVYHVAGDAHVLRASNR